MKLLILIVIFVAAVCTKCPNGDTVVRRGVDEDEIDHILMFHNKYREDVMNGRVPFQPKGIDLLPIEWDDHLTSNAQFSTSSCRSEIRVGYDARWDFVGQNILDYRTYHEAPADWESVIFDWFYEYKHYLYPGNDRRGLTYAQLVWANTTLIGCDFLEFVSKKSATPYRSLYVCNYAPGGNIQGERPYHHD